MKKLIAITLVAILVIQNSGMAQNVLIIWDDVVTNPNTQSLKTALQNAGMSVTMSTTSEINYDGTNPPLVGFDAVIHLNGTTYSAEMIIAGQNSIVDFVQNSGGIFLGSEWNAYEITQGRMLAMQDLILFDRIAGGGAPSSYIEVPAQSSHPILANVPVTFTITYNNSNSDSLHFFPINPSTTLMTDDLGRDVVAVRYFGSGRVVCFYHPGNYTSDATLSNINIQQLYIDAILWASPQDSLDAGITQITSPGSGCGSAVFEDVTVVIRNFGLDTIFTLDASYSVNGGVPVTEIVSTTILPGNNFTYTFASQANLGAFGTYNFDAWTTLAGDTNNFNDSIINFQVIRDSLIVENICIYDVIGGTGNCNFTTDLCADGNDFGDTTLKISAPIYLNLSNIDSVTFYLYYTDCGFGTDFILSLNGVQIGTFTDVLSECTCLPSTYPYIYTITDTAILNAAWSDTNTLSVIHNGLDMIIAGYSATIYSQCTLLTAIEVTNDTSICTGDSVNLTVTVIDSAGFPAPYAFSWSPAAGLSCTTCQSPVASPTSTTAYMVTVTDSTGAQDSAFLTITVFSSPPIADAGLDTIICEKEIAQLNATGGTSYSWSPVIALSDPNIANPLANPVITTNYEVTVTNVCGSDVDTVTVFVNPLPTVDAGIDTSVCTGDSMQLNATGGISYLWIPATGLSDSTISNPFASPSTITTYTVVVTDGNGCVNTDSVTVTVNGVSSLPVYSFSPDPKQDSGTFDGCGTSNTDDYIDWVEISSVNPNTIHVRIQWFPSSSGSYTTIDGIHLKALHYDGTSWTEIYSNLMVPSDFTINALQIDEFDFILPIGSPVGTHQIRTMLIDRSNSTDEFTIGVTCADPSAGTGPGGRHFDNDDVGFDVIGSSFIATADNDTICAGDAVQLQAWGTDSSYLHIWTPGVSLSDSTIPNPLANPVITTSYIVSASKGGCVAYDTVTVYVDTVNFMDASPDTAVCLGDSVQLTATGSGIYLWSPSEGLSCTTCQSPYASPAATTTYYVTTPTGCAPIDSVTVSVGGGPVIASATRDSICPGDTTQLFAYSCAPALFYDGFEDGTYNQWTDAGGGYTITPTTSTAAIGSYSLQLTGGTWSGFDGVYTTFNPDTPDYAGFYVRSSSTSNYDAFVIIGDDNTQTNGGIMSFYADWSGFFNMNGITNTYNANQWYHIEYKNVDFVNITFDYYIDDVLIQSNVPFNNSTSTYISQVHLYNLEPGSIAYYDDIIIGLPCSVIDTTLAYTWSPTTGLSNPNIADPVASPTTTTSYIIVASGGGCSSTDTVTIYTMSLDVAASANTPLICSGDTAQLNATANIGGASFSWSPATGLSCTNCPDPLASPSSTTMYYVTATSGSCTDVDSVLLTVGTGPIPPSCTPLTTTYCCGYGIYNVIFNTINNTTADGIEGYQDYSCTNATNVIVDLTYSISIQTGAGDEENVMVWIDYNNDGVFDNDSTTELVFWSDNVLANHFGAVTIPFSAVINTPLRMRVGSDVWWNTPPSPCTNVLRGQFEDYTVIVLPNTIPPVADFNITVLDTCKGIVSFTDQSLYNPTSWLWDFGDGSGLSTSQNPFNVYSLPGTYTVTLIVTNPWGSDTLTQQVVITSLVADFAVSSNAVGIGEVVNFYDNSIGAVTWDWDFGDFFSSNLQNTFHSYLSAGTYTVTLTVSNASGCIAQMMQQIVVCASIPQTGAIIGPANVNVSDTANYSVTFNNGSTYNWTIIGGSQTSGGQTNFITVQWDSSGVGQITVVETDSIGCTGDPVSLIVTGVNEFQVSGLKFQVFPNPNKGVFVLTINDSRLPAGGGELTIYDMLGSIISKSKIASRTFEIDISAHPAGIYHLQIITDKGIGNKKIIIE